MASDQDLLADTRRDLARKLVELGLCDPVRLFVKQEPHKIEKIETGRLRLIAVLSAVDQIVERLLWGPITKDQIEDWRYMPIKPGMGASDADLAALWDYADWMCGGQPLSNDDVNGWDWSMKTWLQDCVTATTYLVADVCPDSDYGRLVQRRQACACCPVFSLSDGRLIVQVRARGTQLSGRFITSWGNSVARQVLAGLRGARCMNMGDDAIEVSHGVPAAPFYSSLGFRVEESVGPLQGTVFCSQKHERRGVAWPSNWARMVFRYLSRHVGPSDFVQLAEEVRHLPDSVRLPVLRRCRDRALCGAPGLPRRSEDVDS